ncbi:hypothetical protein BDR04DRAFT_1164053 [Suillus decipiens]|nr:hypothetical protein BDR04DRAFT_1164053 [Suillus decipiens]
MHAAIHGKPEPLTVVQPPARPPTTMADLTSSLIGEHKSRCSDSDDEDENWLYDGDITDHLFDILSDHPVQPMAVGGGVSRTSKVVADQATTSSSTPMDDKREEW